MRGCNRKIHEPATNRRERNYQPWEIDLAHELGRADERVRRTGDRVGKESPGQQRRVDKDRVGIAVRRHLREPAEKYREDDHHHNWLDDGPRKAQYRLLIANFDVPHGEHEEKLAIGPKLLQIEHAPAGLRLHDRDVIMTEVNVGEISAIVHAQHLRIVDKARRDQCLKMGLEGWEGEPAGTVDASE